MVALIPGSLPSSPAFYLPIPWSWTPVDGAGVPVTKFLIQRHRVVGIDFSMAQARMASTLVPSALLASVDMTKLAFPTGIFDGVCSFFAILHIPRS